MSSSSSASSPLTVGNAAFPVQSLQRLCSLAVPRDEWRRVPSFVRPDVLASVQDEARKSLRIKIRLPLRLGAAPGKRKATEISRLDVEYPSGGEEDSGGEGSVYSSSGEESQGAFDEEDQSDTGEEGAQEEEEDTPEKKKRKKQLSEFRERHTLVTCYLSGKEVVSRNGATIGTYICNNAGTPESRGDRGIARVERREGLACPKDISRMKPFQPPWADADDGLAAIVCARCWKRMYHGGKRDRQLILEDDGRITVKTGPGSTPSAVSLAHVPRKKTLVLSESIAFRDEVYHAAFVDALAGHFSAEHAAAFFDAAHKRGPRGFPMLYQVFLDLSKDAQMLASAATPAAAAKLPGQKRLRAIAATRVAQMLVARVPSLLARKIRHARRLKRGLRCLLDEYVLVHGSF